MKKFLSILCLVFTSLALSETGWASGTFDDDDSLLAGGRFSKSSALRSAGSTLDDTEHLIIQGGSTVLGGALSVVTAYSLASLFGITPKKRVAITTVFGILGSIAGRAYGEKVIKYEESQGR